MSECESCKNKKDWPCPNTCGYMGTCDGWEPNPITNYDRLRTMSMEKLADLVTGDMCELLCGAPLVCEGQCKQKMLDWLRQEAAE